MEISEVLMAAKAAGLAKAAELWERDGKQDRGSCGNAVLLLKMNTKLAKAAIAAGLASKEGSVFTPMPEGVRSQNADIWQGSTEAFRDVLIANGFGGAIKKFWTYID